MVEYVTKMNLESLSVVPTNLNEVLPSDMYRLMRDCKKNGIRLSVCHHLNEIKEDKLTLRIERLTITKEKE